MSSFELSESEQRFLVKLARESINRYLRDRRVIRRPKNTPSKLLRKCGVFVSLHNMRRGRELRGCIGFPSPTFPLVDATIESAISAATRDTRFPPVTLDELRKIVIEVSVLTPPKLIEVDDVRDYPNEVEIGRDGLIIEKGAHKGLLLPQVAVEQKWDAEEFLCQCCLKAWLSPDEWLSPETRVYTFQAIVFGERTPGGEVKRGLDR